MFMRRLLDSVVVVAVHGVFFLCFFFKQKTAYEMRISDWSSDVCSSDLFAQGTYAIGPQTNITVGARYTNEKKTSDPNNYFIDIGYGLGPLSIGNPNPNPATIIDTPVAVKFNNVSPMATIDHRWSSSIMTYATFSKGVKGGGFQQRVIVPRILQPTFGPEKLTAYEIGAKTDFFDRRLRVNVAAFQSNYNDLQVPTFPGGAIGRAPV